ncbi:unnamed protein product, partial [Brassica rapa]
VISTKGLRPYRPDYWYYVFPRPRTQRVQGNPLFAGSGRLRRTVSCTMAEYYTTV